VDEFSKIRQLGTLEEYLDKFEKWRGSYDDKYAYCTEAYYIFVFTSGLKAELSTTFYKR
jgi:hypothetical protein